MITRFEPRRMLPRYRKRGTALGFALLAVLLFSSMTLLLLNASRDAHSLAVHSKAKTRATFVMDAGVQWVVNEIRSGHSGLARTVWVDAEGALDLRLPPGRWTLFALGPTSTWHRAETTLDLRSRRTLHLRLKAARPVEARIVPAPN